MKHIMNIRVYYEDTDAGGIVYHANYLNFAERGRTEFLRKCGFSNSEMQAKHGVIFVVRHIEIDYLKTSLLDDELQIESTICELKNSSFSMHQRTVRGGVTMADMRVVLVCIDMNSHKPVRLPEDIKEAFKAYQEDIE